MFACLKKVLIIAVILTTCFAFSFTIAPPVADAADAVPGITSITPDHGSPGDVFEVIIAGNNLDNVIEICFGWYIIVGSPFTSQTPSEIRTTIGIHPFAVPGPQNITVTPISGPDEVFPGDFTIDVAGVNDAPVLFAPNPIQGQRGDTLDVTLRGSNLDHVNDVDFGPGITVNPSTSQSDNEIIVPIQILDDADLGPRDVTVGDLWGCTDTLDGAFTVQIGPLGLDSVTPDHGQQGNDNLEVTIQGANLDNVDDVSFGSGIRVNSFENPGPDEIIVDIDIDDDCPVGTRDVTVQDPDGSSAVLPGAFEVQLGPPVVSSVSPYLGQRGGTLDVTLFGSNLDQATGVNFSGGGITVNSFTSVDANRLIANVGIASDADLGARDLTVSSAEGPGDLPDGFTVILELGPASDPPVVESPPPDPPNAAFSAESANEDGMYYVSEPVLFTDESTGTITSRAWNFGDGGSSTEENPSHIYQWDGAFTVSLTVTGPDGSDTEEGTINVARRPGAICVPTTSIKTTASEVAFGWGITFLCWGTGYLLFRRLYRRVKK